MDTFEILDSQLKKYNLKKAGNIHIGAHLGEEAAQYTAMGFKNVMWMEANPELCNELKANVTKYGHAVYNNLLSDKDAEAVDFYITDNNGHSSSMLAPSDAYIKSGLGIAKKFSLKSIRFDTFCSSNNINLKQYNCLNIDVQGAELKVLKGFGALLGQFDIIITEISLKRVYKGSVLFHELNNFFLENGFINTSTSANSYMGEAFYKKSSENISFLQKLKSNLFARFIEILIALGIPQYFSNNKDGFLTSRLKKIYYKTVRKLPS
jgi:FkbM family methyltransferase